MKMNPKGLIPVPGKSPSAESTYESGCGGVHGHGGSPKITIAGWFITEKPWKKRMRTGGTPMT